MKFIVAGFFALSLTGTAAAADPVGLTEVMDTQNTADGFAPAWRQGARAVHADAQLQRDARASVIPRLPATHFESEDLSAVDEAPNEVAEDTPLVSEEVLASSEVDESADHEHAAHGHAEPTPQEALEKDPNAVPMVTAQRPAVSIGAPWRGWLVNGVKLPTNARVMSRKRRNFGTPELVNAILSGVNRVHAKHGKSHRIYVGDLSWPQGGRLSRHKSHQSGRDADIGYYFKHGKDQKSLARATRRTLDAARTWTFIEPLLRTGQAEYIFIDYSLQKPLYEHARDVAKVSPEDLLTYFDYPRGRRTKRGIIRHTRGHADHMHLRVHAKKSVGNVRAYVAKHGLSALKPLPVKYKVRRGQTLSRIARRHRTTVKKLCKWNRMSRRKRLRIGQKLIVGWRRPKLKGL